jgi:hypothetical protein
MYVQEWILILLFTSYGSLLFYIFKQIWINIINKKNNQNAKEEKELCDIHTLQIETLDKQFTQLKDEMKEQIREFKQELIRQFDKLEKKIEAMN